MTKEFAIPSLVASRPADERKAGGPTEGLLLPPFAWAARPLSCVRLRKPGANFPLLIGSVAS